MFGFLKRAAQTQGGDDRIRAALVRILELNKEMARAARPEALPERILDAAIDLAGAERGFLIERADPDAPESPKALRLESGGSGAIWEVVAARALDGENLRKALQKLSRSITSQVLESGRALRSDDALNDESLGGRASISDLKLRSVLCLPLKGAEQQVRGCLYVDNRFARGQFDAETQELLEAFADQAAIALEHVRLLASVERKNAELREKNAQLEEKVHFKDEAILRLAVGAQEPVDLRHAYPTIVGRGRAVRSLLGVLDRITDGDFPVLLLGESGTGKELVARALHENGPRRAGPFVGVNCGAIAEGLLESELFGAVRGAYTGAVKDREGLVEAASGGVLFLDEIGEMSLGLQAKLLRVLQEKRVRPVGGNDEIQVDVRVVSATNRDLAREVASGRFREDLYYRLKVVQVEVPPLRERREDIPVLVEHFLERLASESTPPRPRPKVARECMELLMAHGWPGNVRELQNEITRMFALGGENLGPELVGHLPSAPRAAAATGVQGLVGRRMVDVEADLIRATLELTGGKRGEAARLLGIPRRTFYNRLKALGIE